jgi:hypothetical protein
MRELRSILEDFSGWVSLEIQDARKLDGTYLKAVRSLLAIDWELRTIYFNSTSLILTDIDDYEGIIEVCPDLKKTFVMESEQFNINIYILSFIEHKELNVLLGGAS